MINSSETQIICLVGKSCSGKDSIMKQLVAEEGFLPCVSHTTRPMRDCELEGIEYYFINNSTFKDKMINEDFVEVREYNTVYGVWRYGIDRHRLNELLNKGNVIMILDVDGLTKFYNSEYGRRIISFYIDVDLKTRIQRSLDRETLTIQNLEECVRRAKADEKDFVDAYKVCDYTIKPVSSYCGKLMILDILSWEGVR